MTADGVPSARAVLRHRGLQEILARLSESAKLLNKLLQAEVADLHRLLQRQAGVYHFGKRFESFRLRRDNGGRRPDDRRPSCAPPSMCTS